MSPRLSVLTVVAVCLLSCGSGETTSTEPFTVTKTAVTLDQQKTYFTTAWHESADITVDFSGDAISFVGYFEGSGELAQQPSADGKTQVTDLPLAMFSYVQSPSGTVLLDASKVKSLEAVLSPHRPVSGTTLATDGSAALQWPVADDAEPERGQYTIRIASKFPEGTFYSTIRRNETTAAGTLDLNLFYVNGSGVSTQNDLVVQQAVDEYFRRLEPAGVKRGRIQTFDVSDSGFSELKIDDDSATGAYAKLMQQANLAGNKRAANIFFVHNVTQGTGDGIVKVAGHSRGIPLALGVGPSLHSGVVIALKPFALDEAETKYDIARIGEEIAHNVGHAIGLFHSTEQPVVDKTTFHDLITDTPECPASADTNTDKKVSPVECRDFDATNLMFYASDAAIPATRTFTPGQGYMYRHSVIVRGSPRNQ